MPGGSVAEWLACWFKSQPRRCRVTVLGKLFTSIQAAKLVAALLRVARVTAGLAESNGSLYAAGFMTHVTRRLTAKNGISFGTLRSTIEYGLPFPFYLYANNNCNRAQSYTPGQPFLHEQLPCTSYHVSRMSCQSSYIQL